MYARLHDICQYFSYKPCHKKLENVAKYNIFFRNCTRTNRNVMLKKALFWSFFHECIKPFKVRNFGPKLLILTCMAVNFLIIFIIILFSYNNCHYWVISLSLLLFFLIRRMKYVTLFINMFDVYIFPNRNNLLSLFYPVYYKHLLLIHFHIFKSLCNKKSL